MLNFTISANSTQIASAKDRILSQGPPRKNLTEEQIRRSVVVTNISHQTSDAEIVIYFQRVKNGGGELDHVHIPQKGTAVVTFKSIKGMSQFFGFQGVYDRLKKEQLGEM